MCVILVEEPYSNYFIIYLTINYGIINIMVPAFFAFLAQLVEHSAVNRKVVCSIRTESGFLK